MYIYLILSKRAAGKFPDVSQVFDRDVGSVGMLFSTSIGSCKSLIYNVLECIIIG